MSWENVDLEIAEGVATITLNRPKQMNALFGTMREDLYEAISEAGREARALVITGAGTAFCSGGDVDYLAALRRAGKLEELKRLLAVGRKVTSRLRSLPLPTLAAVNGVAAGAGLSLALACDIRLASDRARFGATFARLGLHPDWGATYFLSRLAGPAAACEMIFTARLLTAQEAFHLGLVNRVVEANDLPAAVGELAQELAAAPPAAVRLAKAAVYRAQQASLEEMLDYEEEAQVACFATADCLEGLSAFEERRVPRFEGK